MIKKGNGGIGAFEAYFEYNRILRTWLVAFGIGGPALFLVHKDIVQQLIANNKLIQIGILFMIGVICQVIGAFLNKIANWYVHLPTAKRGIKGTRLHSFGI